MRRIIVASVSTDQKVYFRGGDHLEGVINLDGHVAGFSDQDAKSPHEAPLSPACHPAFLLWSSVLAVIPNLCDRCCETMLLSVSEEFVVR